MYMSYNLNYLSIWALYFLEAKTKEFDPPIPIFSMAAQDKQGEQSIAFFYNF